LSSILEANAPEKYYLSAKACEGILRRAERRGKQLPAMLKTALEQMIAREKPQEEAEDDSWML
jgi:cytidylate kinase